jgi:hypothetical protein
VGVLLAAYVAYDVIHQFLDFLRDVAYTRKHAGLVMDVLGAVLNFLTTGPGNLVAIIVAAILILWALRTQPDKVDSGNAATPQTDTAHDAAQFKTDLEEAKQEINRLRIELNNRPPRHINTPVEIVETLIPAKAKEIEQQESENEELRTQLAEKDQRINELEQQLAANRRPRHHDIPATLVDTPTPDKAKEIEEENQKLNAKIEELEAKLDEAQQTILSQQRKAMENEHGVADWGSFPVRQIPVGVDAAPLRAENDKLREELQQTKQELEVSKAGERRKRIEKWRADILNHHFQRHPLGGSWFAHTETYSEMRSHPPPKIRDRFESQISAAQSLLGPAHLKGTEGDRRVLLREVSRIEKEWGVILAGSHQEEGLVMVPLASVIFAGNWLRLIAPARICLMKSATWSRSLEGYFCGFRTPTWTPSSWRMILIGSSKSESLETITAMS